MTDDPKALEQGLLALQEDLKAARSDDRREVIRAQYRALHARWMAAKA
jgi:hypothetical protein